MKEHNTALVIMLLIALSSFTLISCAINFRSYLETKAKQQTIQACIYNNGKPVIEANSLKECQREP